MDWSRAGLRSSNTQLQDTLRGPLQYVFLLGVAVEPDTVAQRMRCAGDIEQNPGPDFCEMCKKTFCAGDHPIQCSAYSSWYHKSHTGDTRWYMDKRDDPGKADYECRPCRGLTLPSLDEQPGITPGKCAAIKRSKCSGLIKKGSKFLVCSTCGDHYHLRKSAVRCQGKRKRQ